ncbi:type IV secretory system conjugative DNA transfer family protein [Actinomyces sp. 594]|uniref:VirD4-like conjugal transfer protein, CD1115 family n=1 Tax=Actinomyces sp. 594 TaxID=2057793 RepID=UPI001C5A213E|nr:type IV secretory system conjugative DNA transfer family protein [Actinomyces sp. 594]MBW3069622.1 type IV secretory system conjugative DNA transfer family protein [Actinomyces sp. 594]
MSKTRRLYPTQTLILVGTLVAFWLVNRASEHVREHLDAGRPVATMLDGLPSAITGNLLHISMKQTDLIAGAVVAGMLLLIVLYNLGGRQNTRPGEEQGSAAWADPHDIAPLSTKDPAHRIQLTATEALSIDTRKTGRNLNVCVIGASGTGKTRGYVMPNLETATMSKAITDPKGEIYRRSAPVLKKAGYQVRVLNLVDLHRSGHFNPMSYFDDAQPEASIAQLTECIITNTTTDVKNPGDGFWERAERALLNALIAYVWATKAEDDGGEPSLVDVVDLHKLMQASEGIDADTFASSVDDRFNAAAQIVEEWRKAPADEDEAVMKVLEFACRQYQVFTQGAGETKKSIIISLGVRLAPLDMSDVRKVIADDDLAIDQLGYEPTALFLCIPDAHQTFKFLAAMFWNSLFAKNIYLADHEETGELPVPLHCFLDEFANIGKIPGFPVVISTIRSRGISASVIVQSHTQGKALWRDDWPTIVANCDSILYLGGRDLDTLKWLSALIGEETVTTEDISRTHGTTGSWTKSQRATKRALMTPDEIGRMPNDQALLLVRGLKPFKSPKVRP